MKTSRLITIVLMMLSISIIAKSTPITFTQTVIVASAITMFLNEIKIIKL